MTFDAVSLAVFACLLSFISSVILLIIQGENRKRQTSIEQREAAQREENRLTIEMVMANNDLTYAVAVAVRDGRTNGEMVAAMNAHAQAKQQYAAFLRQQAANHLI